MNTIPVFESGRTDRIQGGLDMLQRCGGYYSCPKDAQGKRRGPLVGYHGRDEQGRQYVGDIYANFAKAERHAPILHYMADRLFNEAYNAGLESVRGATGFCGAPEGGKALACALAQFAESQYIYPEKKITSLATDSSRELSKLVFDRHEPEAGEEWWIVEDVCNNFSTTTTLVELLESFGAKVAGVLCFLNRSLEIEDEFMVREGLILPVFSRVRQPIAQYRQDDPEVAEDVANGNVIWKPKNDWHHLEDAMKRAA
jgi:adenine/guanine phosphoribosyltransferase-like PRPP-binding protein